MAYPDCARKTEGKILNIKYHGKTQIQGKHRKFLDVQNTGRISGPRKKRYRTGPRVERSPRSSERVKTWRSSRRWLKAQRGRYELQTRYALPYALHHWVQDVPGREWTHPPRHGYEPDFALRQGYGGR